MGKIKLALPLVVVFLLLIFTRFVNLDWGLPFPFHPDERNMAGAIQNLSCPNILDIANCLNPKFFAYGQFPIYLGYFLIILIKLLRGGLSYPINFDAAIISLRVIAAFASVLTVALCYQILRKIFNRDYKSKNWLILLLVFSPGLIQFSHFGTTESLLILFFTWVVYESLLFINKKISLNHFLLISSLVTGFAVATKVSAFIYGLIPLVALIYSLRSEKVFIKLRSLTIFLVGAIFFSILFSPQSLINLNEFMGSMRYESGVALGQIDVFYTRQFKDTIPLLFQFTKIFPYTLGLPALAFFLLGFILLPWNKNYNFLRFSFLAFLLPTSFLYVKWTRFMAPVFPIMTMMAGLTFYHLFSKRFKPAFYVAVLISIIPGIAFLSIYTNEDVRFNASNWMNEHMFPKSYILSETANVVDLPLPSPNSSEYTYISFNFYDLDQERKVQEELSAHLKQADYIFVLSRRLFANHPANRYPLLATYYQKLFDGELGFGQVATFTSYPRISVFGKTLLEFPDEQAEETFTVFDHPVVRVFKRL